MNITHIEPERFIYGRRWVPLSSTHEGAGTMQTLLPCRIVVIAHQGDQGSTPLPTSSQKAYLERERKNHFPLLANKSRARHANMESAQPSLSHSGPEEIQLAPWQSGSNIQLAFSSASCACMHDVSPKVGCTSCVMRFCIRMFGKKVKHSSPLSSRSPSRDVFLAYRDYISARILMHPAEVPEKILLYSGTIATEPPAVGDGPKIAATRGLQHCIAWGIGAPKTLHCSVHRF